MTKILQVVQLPRVLLGKLEEALTGSLCAQVIKHTAFPAGRGRQGRAHVLANRPALLARTSLGRSRGITARTVKGRTGSEATPSVCERALADGQPRSQDLPAWVG